MSMLTVLIFSLLILTFTAISSVSPNFGTSSIYNPGPHGLSEILYAYSSAAANNGSASAASASTPTGTTRRSG
jgi:K+-transporting ATPase ATPase A chain